LPPQKREIGMVFQDYALFPHLTIAENIAFGLVERRVARDAIAARVRELLELIRLPDVAARFPSELSGGQQQRVALARAIAFPPAVLLMDEPLGALDLKLREAMQLELRLLQRKLKITTVYVTHDQTEAMTMSDRIAVMSGGRIEQLDDPARIYNVPRTKFVANFVGKVNFLAGRFVEHSGDLSVVATPCARILGPRIADASPGAAVTVVVRPERLRLVGDAAPGEGVNVVEGRIETQTFSGNLYHDLLRLADGGSLLVEIRPAERVGGPGERVRVGWNVADTVIINEA
jgi:ABC-type Fe3+/spermidine/putrescine transport system ATPase subunit